MKEHASGMLNIATLTLATIATDITQIILLTLGIISTLLSVINTLIKTYKDIKKNKDIEKTLNRAKDEIEKEIQKYGEKK